MIGSVKFLIAVWVVFIIWMIYNLYIRPPTPKDIISQEGAGNRIAVMLGGGLAILVTLITLPIIAYNMYNH
jgi:hypothetical protein